MASMQQPNDVIVEAKKKEHRFHNYIVPEGIKPENDKQSPTIPVSEVFDVTVEEAESETPEFVIMPGQWREWFLYCLDSWRAKIIRCVDEEDARRKINLGWHQLKNSSKAGSRDLKGRIRIAKRGKMVYIIPQQKVKDKDTLVAGS